MEAERLENERLRVLEPGRRLAVMEAQVPPVEWLVSSPVTLLSFH